LLQVDENEGGRCRLERGLSHKAVLKF
jgi:hypothetical protein